jgi:outer membrane receptor protein involved in Fe transport
MGSNQTNLEQYAVTNKTRNTWGNTIPFRRTPIAAVLAGLGIVAVANTHAADDKTADADTIAELKAQIASERAEIARLNQELQNARGTQPAGAPAPEAAAEKTDAPAPAPAPLAATVPDGVHKPDKSAELEGIVVSATRNKLQLVEDVPQSISVISGKDLESQLALDVGSILNRAANVTFNVGNSRTYSLSIRGVGKVTVTEAMDTSVGAILDGVPITYPPFASFDFHDIDTVEVARGPQGTSGGKNFTVGTVSINTRNPTFTPESNWSLAFGQHGTVISEVAAGGPVIDNLLAWRGALVVDKGNGPFNNVYYADQTYFNKDRVSGRVKFLATPTPDFSALATVEIQPEGAEFYNSETIFTPPPAHYANTGNSTANTGLDVAGKLGRSWFTNQNNGQNFFYSGQYLNTTLPDTNSQQPLYTFTNNASLQLTQSFANFDLTSITAARQYHFEARNDDGTPFNITINSGGKVDLFRQASEELRLSSKPGGFVDWTSGVFFWENRVDYGQSGWISGWGSDAGAYYANNAQYKTLDKNAAGQLLMENSLYNLGKGGSQSIFNHSQAIFGQADWHLADAFTVTTGARFTHEDRVNNTSTLLNSEGPGAALNPVAVNGVQLGGFSSFTSTVAASGSNPGHLNGALTPNNSAAQVSLANQVAQQYFGVAQYSSLTAAQLAQVAAAKAIRKGQIGTLWNLTEGPEFRKALPGFVVTPSYKLTPNETGYFSVQYGEKGGVSQVVNGEPFLAKAEQSGAIELGLKSASADKNFLFNTDIFKSIIHNYQQVVSILDPLTPATGTVSFVGNAPQVNIYGLEFDGAYSGIHDLRLHYSGAYNIAKYTNFPNSPLPAEDQVVGTNAFHSVTGQFLPGASKYTLNVGGEYRHAIYGDRVFHTSLNTAYLSRYNSDANLSAYAWIPGHSTTDANIGVGRQDEKFDVSLIVKNLFDNQTPQAITLNTITPAYQRWIGIQFSGKL